MKVVYQDEILTVCVKPAGIDSEHELPELLAAQLHVERVFCVHRLDRDVGGLIVCALNGKAAAKLTEDFAAHRLKKEYLAAVEGKPDPPEGTMHDLLYHDPRTNKTFVVNRERKGVKAADLSYRVTENHGDYALAVIQLETGRSHQIRVQFASRKMPLLGDLRYGSKCKKCGIALWSYHLAFEQPVTHRKIDLTEEPPQVWPWVCEKEKETDS